jgi:transcriptional regulator with XRE-family HTH domain
MGTFHLLVSKMVSMTIADDLKRRRKASGMSQSDLAFKCGVSRAAVSRIERGHPGTFEVMDIIDAAFRDAMILTPPAT